jgi:RND family efflux transporter MFP subunit
MMQDRKIVIGMVVACLALVGGVWWIAAHTTGTSKHTPPPPPAKVAQPLKEDQINTITLQPEAVEKLGLQTSAVVKKAMPRARQYGGEVMVPLGKSVIVAAPLNGSLKAASDVAMPHPGQTVKKGQVLFDFLPLLSAEGKVNLATARIEADGQMKSAEAQVAAATITRDRAKQVFESEAGSRRMVDEAQALLDVALKTLEAATARRELLEKVGNRAESGTAAPIPMAAPESGVLRTVAALPGQSVPAGATLFEVVNLDHVWVRVPVYVGELAAIDAEKPALVGELSARSGETSHKAKPVTAPPSANAAAGTADLYFDLDNHTTKYRPGHRVAVQLTLIGEAESPTVPWSAIVHDIHGGSWVYEQTAERTYVRKRVRVRFVTDNTAVLASGPAPGTKVVTAGAAELFGTETGFSK